MKHGAWYNIFLPVFKYQHFPNSTVSRDTLFASINRNVPRSRSPGSVSKVKRIATKLNTTAMRNAQSSCVNLGKMFRRFARDCGYPNRHRPTTSSRPTFRSYSGSSLHVGVCQIKDDFRIPDDRHPRSEYRLTHGTISQYNYNPAENLNRMPFVRYDIRGELKMRKPKKTPKTKYGEAQPVSIAIKPGSFEEYLWKHPEELRRILLEHGVDPDDDSTLGVINIGKKENLCSKADSRSESVHSDS